MVDVCVIVELPDAVVAVTVTVELPVGVPGSVGVVEPEPLPPPHPVIDTMPPTARSNTIIIQRLFRRGINRHRRPAAAIPPHLPAALLLARKRAFADAAVV